MPKHLLAALIAGSLWLTGCELLTNSTLTLPRGSAALSVHPEILAGGYRNQALVKAYTAEDIDHLTLSLFQLDGTSETPVRDASGKAIAQDLPKARLDEPVTFDALLPNTTYRIRAFAYKAPGEDPANLISAGDASSYTDVTLGNDDRPVAATLKVKLADVLFNGITTASGIAVIPGGFTYNQGVGFHLGPAAELIQANSSFWSGVAPVPVPGMTWVYEYWRTYQGETSRGTQTMQVLSVTGNEVLYRFDVVPDEGEPMGGEFPGELSRYGGYPETRDQVFVRAGTETLTVPAATYPDAVKLVQRQRGDETTVWVVPGIGIVKQEVKPYDASTTLYPGGMHLKQFIVPGIQP
jgi:hypothetical protein